MFKAKNYDILNDLKSLFPSITSDPNDCYFEDLRIENEKNKYGNKPFFHFVELRMTLNINNDNRFSNKAPTVTGVFPNQGPIIGGQRIHIHGSRFGVQNSLREVVVRGVLCKNIEVISDKLITCITRASTIMGTGIGNVIIKPIFGLSSPLKSCPIYEYVSKVNVVEPINQLVISQNQVQQFPIYHTRIVSTNQFFKHPFDTEFKTLKADENTLISDQFKGGYNQLTIRKFKPNDDGFGKNRLKKIMSNLKPCDQK